MTDITEPCVSGRDERWDVWVPSGWSSDAVGVLSGIFAFKCSRAEEIFNMLQEVMHSHSISVVEEAVLEPSQQAALTPAGTQTG